MSGISAFLKYASMFGLIRQTYQFIVRAASTANINLAAPGVTIDDVTMVAGDRFLSKDQTTGSENGIYVWNGAAVPATRAPDADNVSELKSGSIISVREGTVNADTLWLLTTDGTIVIGTTALTFAKYSTNSTINPAYGLFRKADPTIAAFTKTAAFAVSTAAALYAEVNGVSLTLAASTPVTMPGLPAAGTDYAIWWKTNNTLEATSNFVTPPTANARKIGGFHYAPGGNATGVAGGDTTPAINAYSFWDLKFKPECPDPRGMTLVADGFWADIYLLGQDWLTNGTSAYNVTIADGLSPPKIPTKFGGNGTTAYVSLTWWEAAEVMRANGKRLSTYSEFAALAYGTTEAASATAATDPVSTILRAESTSKWGIMLSTGNMYVWGDEFAGPYGTTAWTANTGGRGSTFNLPNGPVFGGHWGSGANSGSRSVSLGVAPTDFGDNIGARGVADHLIID